jgi:hypothetical protein
MFEKVKKMYAICIICVSLADFPEPSLFLASMFYHFEPDNDLNLQLGVYIAIYTHVIRVYPSLYPIICLSFQTVHPAVRVLYCTM